MDDSREDRTDAMLGHLLREAGRSAPAPEPIAGLADRVRCRWASRRRRRKISAAMAGLVVLAAASGLFLHAWSRSGRDVPSVAGEDTSGSPGGIDAAANEAELARLRTEIAELRAEARRLEEAARQARRREELAQRLAALGRELGKPDPTLLAQIEYEKTAFLLTHRAESRHGLSPAERLAAYRQAASLFPETTWGRIAQKRLDERPSQEPKE